jgi:UDP-N-acetylmuramyl pentapeptide phosphotransferase/UDP-N-acetylglucosamine-1-phosphate transferase
MMKNNFNVHVRVAYTISLIMVLPILVPVTIGFFDIRFSFNPDMLFSGLPAVLYLIYVHFIVRTYYQRKLDKRILALEKIIITIDEAISTNIEKAKFNYLGLGSNIDEYFFTIYNRKYNKYFRISSVGNRPDYDDVYIPYWEGKEIIIYVDPKELDNAKDTIFIFRFIFRQYNFEDNYKYSISEDIAKKGFFKSLLLLYPFAYICIMGLINMTSLVDTGLKYYKF